MIDDEKVVETAQLVQQELPIQHLDEIIQAAQRITREVYPDGFDVVFRGWIAARFGVAIR